MIRIFSPPDDALDDVARQLGYLRAKGNSTPPALTALAAADDARTREAAAIIGALLSPPDDTSAHSLPLVSAALQRCDALGARREQALAPLLNGVRDMHRVGCALRASLLRRVKYLSLLLAIGALLSLLSSAYVWPQFANYYADQTVSFARLAVSLVDYRIVPLGFAVALLALLLIVLIALAGCARLARGRLLSGPIEWLPGFSSLVRVVRDQARLAIARGVVLAGGDPTAALRAAAELVAGESPEPVQRALSIAATTQTLAAEIEFQAARANNRALQLAETAGNRSIGVLYVLCVGLIAAMLAITYGYIFSLGALMGRGL